MSVEDKSQPTGGEANKGVDAIDVLARKHHYMALPCPGGKHITVATMDHQNAMQVIIPARGINHVFRDMPVQPVTVTLQPTNTDGFVAAPGTVIEVNVPESLLSRMATLRAAFYSNRTSPNGNPPFRPHMTFANAEEANAYRQEHVAGLPLTQIQVVHAKAKQPVFTLDWTVARHHPDATAHGRVLWHPSYRQHLAAQMSDFAEHALSFTQDASSA